MLRFGLVLLVVFAIPFIAWFAWRRFRGGEEPAPVTLLIASGFACSVIALLSMSLLETERGASDGVYAPPSLQDGQVRPGRFQDREREPSDNPA